MYSLFKKEIKIFLGSLTGYIAVLVFLLVTSLFLWVFPGMYNIPDGGYATLQGLFSLAPWLYLFLIPAITMRFFAEEKRSGTLEVLLTRPISDFEVVVAKFLAGMVLVLLSLLPTLLYFLSVWWLGNPVGSIDAGATWGSFIGLFFLAAIYVAIGIFASSLTDNSIVSFILGMVLAFVFYLGFDFIGSSGVPYTAGLLLSWLSINNHYNSISRGVIDLRDIVYFTGMALLFLWFTAFLIRKGKIKNIKELARSMILPAFVIFILFISSGFLFRIDLTADKRYSLSEVTKQVVAGFDRPAEVELFLTGALDPGLRNLQQEILEKIAVINVYAAKAVRIKVTDPYRIANQEKRNRFIEELMEKGIKPIRFQKRNEQGVSSELIFPGALVHYGSNRAAVNFLKSNPDFSYETNFNHSIESVEFELVNAFNGLMREKRSTVAFLEGQGELNRFEVMDFTNALSGDFNVERISVEELSERKDDIRILIVAGPTKPFAEREKFFIDQFIMNGGNVMWLIDPVQVSPDSLSQGYMTFALPRDLNLGDQLFRYGVRLNYELLQDAECLRIRVNTAPPGTQPQFTLHPWYYSPLLVPSDNHPLSRNIDRVAGEFVSSVDTVSGSKGLAKSVILSTTPYARRVKSPSSVSLENISNPPARELFNTPYIPVGVLVEGIFPSVFQHRLVEDLGFSSSRVVQESKPVKMVVIADGGMIANRVGYSVQPPEIYELGEDRVSGRVFANKEFLLNAVYYLNDERGIMQLRSRNIKLRLLDRVRLREEKTWWQWLNSTIPVMAVALFGIVYNFFRKRRFARRPVR